jgi:hypothetical protein
MGSIRTKQEQFDKRKIAFGRKFFNPLFLYGFWRRGLQMGTPAAALYRRDAWDAGQKAHMHQERLHALRL